MPIVDTFATDFPHGSPQGYYDGCKTNPPCANFGSEEWLTCKEAFANRSTDFAARKLPLDQRVPRPRAEKPAAAPKPRPSKPLTVEPVVDVYEELAAEAGTALNNALDVARAATQTFQQPLVDPHPTMTDKEKRGHYSKGCRLQPCKDAVTKAAREKREEKKRLDKRNATYAETTATVAEQPTTDETYSIEHEVITEPAPALSAREEAIVAHFDDAEPFDTPPSFTGWVGTVAATAPIAELYEVPPELLTTNEHTVAYAPIAAIEDTAPPVDRDAQLRHAIEQRDQARDAAFTLRGKIATLESDAARHNHDYQALYRAHEKLRAETAIDEALTRLDTALADDGLQGRLTAAEDLAREQLAEIDDLRTECGNLRRTLAHASTRLNERSPHVPESATITAGAPTVTIVIGSR